MNHRSSAHAATSTNLRRSWLCIAYAFPPINRSGTHRPLGFVRHLHALGWDASVLTVPPRAEPIDESLLESVPSTTRIIRTAWFDPVAVMNRCLLRPGRDLFHIDELRTKCHYAALNASSHSTRMRDWVSRWVRTPDSRVTWLLSAVPSALIEIHRRRPDVIFSTSPYDTAHLIALLLHQSTRIPWVADFRDPWCGNPFRPTGPKSIERWNAALETAVLRRASHIVCNSPTMTDALIRRNPAIDGKCSTILNGFDAERFDAVSSHRAGTNGDFVLAHAGQFYGPRSPGVWFRALRGVRNHNPSLAARVTMVLIGPDQFEGQPLESLARQAGIADRVRILGPKSHREALSILAGADAVMLAGAAGSGAELQIPNKLYEYLALRRPILTLAAANSPVRTILRDAAANAVVCEPGDEAALSGAIIRLATGRHVAPANTWSGVSLFDRRHSADQLHELFVRLTRTRPITLSPESKPRRGLVIRPPTARARHDPLHVKNAVPKRRAGIRLMSVQRAGVDLSERPLT